MYRLEAVIGTERALATLTGQLDGVFVTHLAQHLAILPMTGSVFDALAVPEAPVLDGFGKAPAGLGPAMAAASLKDSVAYVEAEYFGGVGTQSAQVWSDGEVTLGPLHLAEGEAVQAAGAPISQALQRLGAALGNHDDHFDAVGLGRNRETEGWLANPGLR